ncbi:hypothetical protein O181_020867 [Austropuccinia psidii MF-1]|uniref:Uncharacterized protein n=1 Tax=Austropuccinia psidii MF-1 TaxID=1389203 RepID=A0A9Q3GVQ5_9BASI|nr:hypothetical protein [Austropuccinia psidii MF-1]
MCQSQLDKTNDVGWDNGFISIRQGEGDTATDPLVPSSDTIFIHQKLFNKVVCTRQLHTSRDRDNLEENGMTPALHNRPTKRIVPDICAENATSRMTTYPPLTGSLSVTICTTVMEESESAKKNLNRLIEHK